MLTRWYTADEGEFFDITHATARALLTRGRDELTRCAGVAPEGFIAPAWLLGAEGEGAARDLGFGYTTRVDSISDLAAGRRLQSQSLCWSVRGRSRRVMSLAWNRLLFQALRPNPLVRLAIHPPDLGHSAVWRQIQLLAARALEDREAMAYRDYVIRWRQTEGGEIRNSNFEIRNQNSEPTPRK